MNANTEVFEVITKTTNIPLTYTGFSEGSIQIHLTSPATRLAISTSPSSTATSTQTLPEVKET